MCLHYKLSDLVHRMALYVKLPSRYEYDAYYPGNMRLDCLDTRETAVVQCQANGEWHFVSSDCPKRRWSTSASLT